MTARSTTTTNSQNSEFVKCIQTFSAGYGRTSLESTPLISFFNEICPLSEEFKLLLDNGTLETKCKKGHCLVSPGSQTDSLFLIVKGLIRGYIQRQSADITTWFADSGIIGSMPYMGLFLLEGEHMEALEDSELIWIPSNLMKYLYENFEEAHMIVQALVEDRKRAAVSRMKISNLVTATDQWRAFIDTQPSLSSRIPLYYVTSYLNINLDTLFRVRAANGKLFL